MGTIKWVRFWLADKLAPWTNNRHCSWKERKCL